MYLCALIVHAQPDRLLGPQGGVSVGTNAEFDYIIIGAGSAGCVIANRLSEDPGVSVLLIEAGAGDKSIYIDMPCAFRDLISSRKFSWNYLGEREPSLSERQMVTPRGKVLGGSSTINGLRYQRGNALDYDNWCEMGATGWSYREILPYFKRAETFSGGGDDFRGDSGPLHTTLGTLDNPLYQAFIEAAAQAGYPRTTDTNGYQQEGFGRQIATIGDGYRWSAARGYLHPVRHRNNLEVHPDALVHRVLVEGNRAGGVVYERGGEKLECKARREVILSAGSINSPQLLMLSGLGPAEELRANGIEVVKDLPGVGKNLNDHLAVYLRHASPLPVSLQLDMLPRSEIREHKVTHTIFMGAVATFLFNRPAHPDDADNPLRLVLTAPMPAFWREFEERFGLQIVSAFGATELNMVSWANLDAPHIDDTAGRPCEHFEMRIGDDHDEALPVGVGGEILVRPKRAYTMMTAYYKNPEATAETWHNLWHHTGDLGYMDEAGYLHFLGRKKDSIRRRGENISAFEVEEVLDSHPEVVESAVVGVPSEYTEEEVKAVLALRTTSVCAPREIVDWAKGKLPRYALPRYVEFVDELPHTDTGKVQKTSLRERWKTTATFDIEKNFYLEE